MPRKRTTPTPELDRAARAVYDLVRVGAVQPAHEALYAAELDALAGAGLVRRESGRYVDAVGGAPPPRPAAPVMRTFVVRLPAPLIARIERRAKGTATKSDVARQALEAGLGVLEGRSPKT